MKDFKNWLTEHVRQILFSKYGNENDDDFTMDYNIQANNLFGTCKISVDGQ